MSEEEDEPSGSFDVGCGVCALLALGILYWCAWMALKK